MKFATATGKARRAGAFTLAEVLAALMFMAIVIPVVVDAMHVAGQSGEFAARKSAAVRVADKVLNETIASTNWTSSVSGVVTDSGHDFHWTLNNQSWPQDSALQLVTVEVTFSAGGRECAVHLSTLANVPGATATMTTMQ